MTTVSTRPAPITLATTACGRWEELHALECAADNSDSPPPTAAQWSAVATALAAELVVATRPSAVEFLGARLRDALGEELRSAAGRPYCRR